MRLPLVLLALAMVAAGCSGPKPVPTSSATTPIVTPPPAFEPRFDGERALAYAGSQVLREDGSVRYRIPGTVGSDEAADLIARDLAANGWNVSWQRFAAGYRCDETPMKNVIGERSGPSGKTIILGAHYDTRPVADKDPDPARRGEPVPGGNDGASGVAVLLELSRVMPRSNDTVRLVFFDGEDGGKLECDTPWIIGSQHYVDEMSARDLIDTKAMVVVDMVGDPALVLPKERLSMGGPGRALQERLYEIGAGLGYGAIFTNSTRDSIAVEDDHKPFLQATIPAVDLIHLVAAPDFFPAWHHTVGDDLSNVSAESLEAVGRTLEAWLQEGG